jgi:hypothetical protein
MKNYIKWAFLCLFIFAGVWAAAIAPEAAFNMLPEVELVHPRIINYREEVRGAGVIFSRNNQFYLSAAVREGDINSIETGQPAELHGAAIGDGNYTATVFEIASFARQAELMGVTETVVDVVLLIDNPDELLRPGYTATAIIGVSEMRELMLIPYTAINQDDRGEYVFVLAGNTALRRDIITGIELAEGAEMLAGVREGDDLIVRPERFAEGALVRAVA